MGYLGCLPIITSYFGNCPITVISNAFLKGAGVKEYPDLLRWLANFLGIYGALFFFVFTCAISLRLGFMARGKQTKG